MIQMWAITVKELKLLIRDPGGLVLLFVMPAMFILLLSVALQGAFSGKNSGDRLPVLVLNEDEGETGLEIMTALEDTGYFRIVARLNGQPLTRESITAEINGGDHRIAVIIPATSSRAVRLELDDYVDIVMDPALATQFAVIAQSTIRNLVFGSIMVEMRKKGERMQRLQKAARKTKASMDPSAAQLGMPVPSVNAKRLGKKAGQSALEKLRRRRAEKAAKLNPEPLPSEEERETVSKGGIRDPDELPGLRVRQSYASISGAEVHPNSVQQSVPGWTVFALFWIAQIIAVNLLQEKSSGAYSRILVAPISLIRYLAGKMFPFFLVNMVQAILMFTLGILILPLLGCPHLEITNVVGMLLVTVAISVVAISFGLFMASVSKTSFLVASMSASVLIVMTVLAGIMVPKFVMPVFMQEVSAFVPHGWAFDAYLNLLIRDYSTVQVLPHIGMLLLFAAGFGILAIWRLSKTARIR